MAYAIAVITSKNVIGTPPPSSRASTIWTIGAICHQISSKVSALISRPSTQIRSVASTRWGLENRPVRNPIARSRASIMIAVLPLPLVPVTWMTGQASCGSPSSSHSAAIRSSDGCGWLSGQRAVRYATSSAWPMLRDGRAGTVIALQPTAHFGATGGRDRLGYHGRRDFMDRPGRPIPGDP